MSTLCNTRLPYTVNNFLLLMLDLYNYRLYTYTITYYIVKVILATRKPQASGSEIVEEVSQGSAVLFQSSWLN